ncbi:hypothetical protein CCM_03702 [Cordyceps militaris CM01]|uniref:Uncharacterized protein n=1 Tax=Cordyceps militaris (strain CM01) TaxID=983644 RepID=G3JG52_CORMM|nr:uncharacterized protein CCM_03702 [Cordyceps militaris CM01]EGX92330.1 hypothetical protein CCM_03702 [Cordyceps militaris CM01]
MSAVRRVLDDPNVRERLEVFAGLEDFSRIEKSTIELWRAVLNHVSFRLFLTPTFLFQPPDPENAKFRKTRPPIFCAVKGDCDDMHNQTTNITDIETRAFQEVPESIQGTDFTAVWLLTVCGPYFRLWACTNTLVEGEPSKILSMLPADPMANRPELYLDLRQHASALQSMVRMARPHGETTLAVEYLQQARRGRVGGMWVEPFALEVKVTALSLEMVECTLMNPVLALLGSIRVERRFWLYAYVATDGDSFMECFQYRPPNTGTADYFAESRRLSRQFTFGVPLDKSYNTWKPGLFENSIALLQNQDSLRTALQFLKIKISFQGVLGFHGGSPTRSWTALQLSPAFPAFFCAPKSGAPGGRLLCSPRGPTLGGRPIRQVCWHTPRRPESHTI